MNSDRKEKFTPGPWCTIGADISPSFNTFFTVATVSSWDDGEEEYGANAALIAAAPEMYDLLREIYERPNTFHFSAELEFRGKIEAVLEKARGEA